MKENDLGQKNCWNVIGVWGDRTCPTLPDEIHCRNCSVYSKSGRSLLERSEPEGYTAQWTALMAEPSHQQPQQQLSAHTTRLSLTIFRLGEEWLALPASIFDQAIAPSPVHAIPHHTDPLLRGIVNVRGQLLPCVSIHSLVGITANIAMEKPFPGKSTPTSGFLAKRQTPGLSSPAKLAPKPCLQSGQQGGYPRLVVVKKEREVWSFDVDELYGLHFCQAEELRRAPALNNQSLASLTQSIFTWHEKNVSYLDVEQLFAILRQRAI
ncbi:MAG: chemotaxis protein CheW [Cyanobacteria bacterium P01_F01_bin.3]